jgi:SAM-dependent methyltransferase
MNKESVAYKSLCTEFYDLDKPIPPQDALQCYLRFASEAQGPILEPMCGTGRFLIPLLERGFQVTGFDSSPNMLSVCRKKCQERGLTPHLFESTFETFQRESTYNLIFIPSGSFGLLIDPEQVSQALSFITNSLNSGGKFIVEIETLKTNQQLQGIWRGRWASRPDNSKIVLSALSQFDSSTKIETVLCRYELWEMNEISQIEVEEFPVKHYEPNEIEDLLNLHGLTIAGKWQAEPHSGKKGDDTDEVILYECVKS